MWNKLVMVLFLYIVCSGAQSRNSVDKECAIRNCTIVIDAGSTGSRLHLYAPHTSATQSTNTAFDELYVLKINPGLASIKLDETAINHYLSDLFNNLSIQNVPVYFYATGGMRLLDAPKQAQYFNLLKKWFVQHSKQYNLVDARIINGREEGLFGWLAVNEVLGRLHGLSSNFVGMLDIGGASTQIVFPLSNDQDVFAEDIIHIKLDGNDIRLFSHSFLGLGSNSIDQRFNQQPSCEPLNYPINSSLLGSGNGYECEKIIEHDLNNDDLVSKITHEAIKNNPISAWYNIGAVSYLIKDQPFISLKNDMNAKNLLDLGQQEICNRSWSDLQLAYSNNSTKIKQECLMSAYYYALTVNGYGINEYNKIEILPENNELDWTLGVVIYNVLHNNIF